MNGRMLERDEDLLLFRELHKREKDRIATLLQPVSDEFEPASGNFALYRISSGKKGSGFQFFPDNNKNDYDWLKTPPATPLFPSLEMEANAAQPVVQRELPIIRPFSRFAGHSQKESANSRPKSPNPKPKCLSNPPSYNRPKTQLVPKTNIKAAPTLIQPTNYDPLKSKRTSKQVNHKDDPIHFLTANLSKNPNPTNKTNPRSRGVSPLARSTIPVEMRSSNPRSRGVSPLARSTNPVEMRSSSAARGRLVHQNASSTSSKTPRQSCSPCVTRGRRVEETKKEGKGTQILGSKMVERVMNARKTNSSVSIDESQRDAAKQKLRGETRDFARTKHLHMRRGGQH